MEIQTFTVLLLIAFCIDLTIGDPAPVPHPVRWIGRAISMGEAWLRKGRRGTSGPESRALGVVLALAVTATAYILSWLALALAFQISVWLYYLLYIYLIWASLSLRSLALEAGSVISAMKAGDIEVARERLSRIVGRDTASLSEAEVYRAAAETVAENTSDGVVAPLFYLAIGGPPLMLAYKAVNTLDSMTGYRNERYRDFGWFSARLDDWANWVPARVTALFMVAASLVLGLDWRSSMEVVARDGRNHSSPNAGLPEAAVAGATGVRFGGPASYGGVEEVRPFIGEGRRGHGPSTALSAIRILYATALLSVPGALLLRFFISRLL